mmetsp:Transcript_14377/g.42790  ORF Transcript_14377/g.42790 Transcript_14377/m.42790 type:complete len:373 (+) Transcript_14377:340-1458(+)
MGEGLRPASFWAAGSPHLRVRATRGRVLCDRQPAEGGRRGHGLLGCLLQVVAAGRFLGPRPLPGRQAWLRDRRCHAGHADGVLRIRDDAPPGGPDCMPAWRDAIPGLRREDVLPPPPGPLELRRQRREELDAACRQPRDRPHPPRPARPAGQDLHGHGLRRAARRLGQVRRPPRCVDVRRPVGLLDGARASPAARAPSLPVLGRRPARLRHVRPQPLKDLQRRLPPPPLRRRLRRVGADGEPARPGAGGGRPVLPRRPRVRPRRRGRGHRERRGRRHQPARLPPLHGHGRVLELRPGGRHLGPAAAGTRPLALGGDCFRARRPRLHAPGLCPARPRRQHHGGVPRHRLPVLPRQLHRAPRHVLESEPGPGPR